MDKNVKRASAQGNPTIARLTPFADALALLDRLAMPVAPRAAVLADAARRVLAADIVVATRPARPTALRDGWAVRADALADAGGYAPAQLATVPLQIETGDELPPNTDAVAPPEIIIVRGSHAEAVGAVTAGDGVLPAGGEIAGAPLRRSGERLRAADLAVMRAAGVSTVQVRTPRLRIVAAREDLRLLPAVELVARDCAGQGGDADVRNGADPEAALLDIEADALVIVGGTGSGARDVSVRALAQAGRVAMHGVGLTPGETAAIGECNGRPVLLLPGRLDAALAVWLTLGRHLLARLSGAGGEEPGARLVLSRKISSTVGLAEFVPIRRHGLNAEPLAFKYLPLSALARADGWLLVPPDSEGYPVGDEVAVKAWP